MGRERETEREGERERVPHPQTQRERNAWVVLVLVLVVSVILGIFIRLTLHRFSDLSLAAVHVVKLHRGVDTCGACLGKETVNIVAASCCFG